MEDYKETYQAGNLEEGYWLINEKRVLYWNGKEWQDSVKNTRGNHGGWIRPLEKQPKIIKSISKYNTLGY